jgi:hypothetical protein
VRFGEEIRARPILSLGVAQAMLHGRSYWSVIYRGGKVVGEWQPGHPDWSELSTKGVIEAHLICPNRKVGALSVEKLLAERRDKSRPPGRFPDLEGRLFQYKGGDVSIRTAYQHMDLRQSVDFVLGRQVVTNTTEGQVLGLIEDGNGTSTFFAWWRPGILHGPLVGYYPHIKAPGALVDALYSDHVGVHHR